MVILPEVEKVEFGYCNIRSFLFDWFDFRKNYLKTKEMPILNLGMNYYYDEGSRENRVVKFQNGRSYDILLSNASSGLQSVAPLLAFIDYLTDGFYAQEEDISPLLNERKTQTDRRLIEELILKKYFNNNRKDNIRDEINEIKEKIKTGDDHLKRLLRRLGEVEENLFSTHNTQFIIEEPEQNLFPDTQRDLVYHLLDKCLDDERNHRLTITTHSPYILYALNNCMMGGLIGDKMKDADKGKVKCRTSCIDPSLVSIHEIHDGILKSIQQDDGLIGKNYFDVKMKELMDDFYVMLNYYGA
jgi:hypothetical protein